MGISIQEPSPAPRVAGPLGFSPIGGSYGTSKGTLFAVYNTTKLFLRKMVVLRRSTLKLALCFSCLYNEFMRKKNTVRNAKYMLLAFVLQSGLSFAFRTAFIHVLGGAYLGLDALFLNIISLVSVAELGIGVAIAYAMYKPAAKNDIERLKTLNYLYKNIYRIVFFVVMVVGLALIPFLPHFIGGGIEAPVNIYIVYSLFLISSLVTFLAAHRRTLIFVFQRQDVLSKIGMFTTSLSTLARIGVLFLTRNYYVVVSLWVVFILIENIIVLFISHKMFPEIRGKGAKLDLETMKSIKKNVIGLAICRIGEIFIWSSIAIQISIFFGLEYVALFANYSFIVSIMFTLIGILFGSVRASIGNAISNMDIEYNKKIFNSLRLGIWIPSGILTVVFISVINSFITVWIGGNWTLAIWTVFFIALRFHILNMRSFIGLYQELCGLLYNDRYKRIIEIIVYLPLSIVLAQTIGLKGIFIAAVISSLVVCVTMETYVVFKNYFKQNFWPQVLYFFIFLAISVFAIIASYFATAYIPVSWYFLPIKALIATATTSIIYFSLYWFSRERHDALVVLKQFFNRRKEKESVESSE